MVAGERLQPGQTEEPVRSGLFNRLFGGDRPLWIIFIILLIASMLVIYSSTEALARKHAVDTMHYPFKQLIPFFIGFVIMWLVHRVNYQSYICFTKLLFWLALGLMVLTSVLGENLNGASRWLRIPFIDTTFQPSDFMRITLVALLAQQLAKRQRVIDKISLLPALTPGGWSRNPRKNREILLETTIPMLGPVALACVAIFPSDFSTAVLTFFTCCIMLFIGRVRVRELWRLMTLVIVTMAAIVAVMYLLDVGRSHTWVNRLGLGGTSNKSEKVQMQSDTDDFQVMHAKIAIASGRFLGRGPGNSTEVVNLPHPYSDFAYAFIIEEYGLVGSLVILALYLWIFFRGIVIFRRCATALPSLLVLGLSLMITLQALVNMMVSVGLFPVTGQPLPLISLGGSSVVFMSLALGIILGVSRQMKEQSLDRPRSESLLE